MRFCTGLFTHFFESECLPPLAIPSGENFKYVFIPSHRNKKQVFFGENSKELLIEASFRENAECALDLLITSVILLDGDLFIEGRPLLFHPSDDFLLPEDRAFAEQQSIYVPRLSRACMLATIASYDPTYVSAMAKYFQAVGVFPPSSIILDAPNIGSRVSSYLPTEYTQCARSIVFFYGVLEELGLDVRATREKPSRVKGKWNLEVKRDLEARLHKRGINTRKKILWRLSSDSLERIEVPLWFKDQQGHAFDVGEVTYIWIDIVDAIALLSWLRSKAAAHATNRLTYRLSLNHVINARFLARKLVVESLGFRHILN